MENVSVVVGRQPLPGNQTNHTYVVGVVIKPSTSIRGEWKSANRVCRFCFRTVHYVTKDQSRLHKSHIFCARSAGVITCRVASVSGRTALGCLIHCRWYASDARIANRLSTSSRRTYYERITLYRYAYVYGVLPRTRTQSRWMTLIGGDGEGRYT